MRVLILFSLLFPLAAGPLATAVSARVEPKLGTWLMTGAALLLAGTSCGALGLLVLSPLVQMTWVANLGHWSSSIMSGAGLPGGWTSLGAAVALGAALLAAVAFAVRRGRALSDAWQHARSLPGHGELVVTGDAAADAYAVPGWPGRIVVSEGMLGALDDRGRAALLAHERAHLTNHHHWFTAVARLAAAANPLVRPLASAVEYSVERWADEAAAAEVGDRYLVARAIANAAIAAKATKARSAMSGALAMIGSGLCSRVTRRRRAFWRMTWLPARDDRPEDAAPTPRRFGRETRTTEHDDRWEGATPMPRLVGRMTGTTGPDDRPEGHARAPRRFGRATWLPGHDDRPDGAAPAPRRVARMTGTTGPNDQSAGARPVPRRFGRVARMAGRDDRPEDAARTPRRFGRETRTTEHDDRWEGATPMPRRFGRVARMAGRDGRLAGAGPVPRRVAALLAPAPTSRRSMPTLAASVLFLGAVAVCALVAADHLQDLLSFAHATVDRGMRLHPRP